MKEFEDIINFEHENTTLDFKAIQYIPEKFENLIKDIISMANSKTNEEKHIIIGVNYNPNGKRTLVGINEDFVDDSIYQQLIHENVEPEIEFQYFPFELNSKLFGVFRIGSCPDPPYMLKKEFKKLKKGDSFIRKGSHQTGVLRRDYDYFYLQKELERKFTGKIFLNFEESGTKTLVLNRKKNLELPSRKAESEIKKIIREKEEIIEQQRNVGIKLPIFESIEFGGIPYEKRSIATLKQNLELVSKTYEGEDFYYVFEENSNKINLIITNNGNEYIEDSSIEVQFEANDSFLISQKVYEKPVYNSWPGNYSSSNYKPNWKNMHYPTVNKTEKGYKIFENIGNIKHNVPVKVFKVPIRFVAKQNCINIEIVLKIRIFGKNLSKPYEDELKIIVIE